MKCATNNPTLAAANRADDEARDRPGTLLIGAIAHIRELIAVGHHIRCALPETGTLGWSTRARGEIVLEHVRVAT